MANEQAVDDFLAHYGVKGMKWGQRRARKKELNKAAKEHETRTGEAFTRRKNREKQVVDLPPTFKQRPDDKIRRDRDKKIVKARERVKSGQTKNDYKRAKQQYKIDKEEKGKYAAKLILADAKQKRAIDVYNSQQARDGREAVTATLTAIGNAYLQPR